MWIAARVLAIVVILSPARFSDFSRYDTIIWGQMMAGRYVCDLVHLVWSTAGRREWIDSRWETDLFAYLGGISRNKKSRLIAAGGMPDHIHLLVSVAPTLSVSELVSVLKSNSSRWIHESASRSHVFRWQQGYGAFSVSRSMETTVADYILRQKHHHQRRDFKSELLELLRRHEIEYDDRYLWD